MKKINKQADILLAEYLKFMGIPDIPFTRAMAATFLIDSINKFREEYNREVKMVKKIAKIRKK